MPHPKHRLLLRVGVNEDRNNNDSGLPTIETASGRRKVPDTIDFDQRFNTPQDFLDYHRLDLELAYDWQIHDVLRFRQRLSHTRDTYEYFSTEGLAFDPVAAPQQVDRTFYFYFHHHWFPLLSQSEFVFDFFTGPVIHRAIVAYEFNAMLNRVEMPAYWLLDAAIWYERGPLRLAVNGTNLTNETQYFVSAIDTQLTPGSPLGVLGQMSLRF